MRKSQSDPDVEIWIITHVGAADAARALIRGRQYRSRLQYVWGWNLTFPKDKLSGLLSNLLSHTSFVNLKEYGTYLG